MATTKESPGVGELVKEIKASLATAGVSLSSKQVDELIASKERGCGSCWSIGCKDGCDKGCLSSCKPGNK